MNIGNLYNVQASVFVKLTEPDKSHVQVRTTDYHEIITLLYVTDEEVVNFPSITSSSGFTLLRRPC